MVEGEEVDHMAIHMLHRLLNITGMHTVLLRHMALVMDIPMAVLVLVAVDMRTRVLLPIHSRATSHIIPTWKVTRKHIDGNLPQH